MTCGNEGVDYGIFSILKVVHMSVFEIRPEKCIIHFSVANKVACHYQRWVDR